MTQPQHEKSAKEILIEELERIGTGQKTPAQAAPLIREAIKNYDGLEEYVYRALEGVTWLAVKTEVTTNEYANWFDLFRHASALLKSRNNAETAIKIHTLSELVSRTARYHDNQRLDEIMQRKQDVSILQTIDANGGSASYQQIQVASNLNPPILAAKLFTLTASGLLSRDHLGEEARFTLTDLARRNMPQPAPAA